MVASHSTFYVLRHNLRPAETGLPRPRDTWLRLCWEMAWQPAPLACVPSPAHLRPQPHMLTVLAAWGETVPQQQ